MHAAAKWTTIQVTQQNREEEEEGQQQKRGAIEEHMPQLQKFQCRNPHRVDPDKCMWNKKYKGYRFKSICDKLEMAFKPHHLFMAEMGRYAKMEDLESK